MLTLTVVYGIEADTIGQLTREVPPLYRLGRRAASHERGTHVGLRRSNKWHQAKELVTIAGIETVTIGQLTREVPLPGVFSRGRSGKRPCITPTRSILRLTLWGCDTNFQLWVGTQARPEP
jgi:hypothetical protein